MALDIFRERGTPLDKQEFDWHDLVRAPISKLDESVFTRVRILLMSGIEAEALRFGHAVTRMRRELQLQLARVRRIEQRQQTLIGSLLPPDRSPLEASVACEQASIEVTASLAQSEPDPYVKQLFRFALLEHVDHLYRFAALLDRVEGKDPNAVLRSQTDIRPGRPTTDHHRAPGDDLREPYDRKTAQPITKLNALTQLAAEYYARDYYMHVGSMLSDPVARLLYAEIAAVEDQHVTEAESSVDPYESWLEKWVLHEACEVYNYLACAENETNPRVRGIWERFVDYELGHLHYAIELFKMVERRDPHEILDPELPPRATLESHRAYIREVLTSEIDLRANGPHIVPRSAESTASIEHRRRINATGSPSEAAAKGYVWSPGSELASHDGPGPAEEAAAP